MVRPTCETIQQMDATDATDATRNDSVNISKLWIIRGGRGAVIFLFKAGFLVFFFLEGGRFN